MQTYREAAEYTSPDLEAGLIAAIRYNPALYWETRDLLPTDPLDAFAVHWKPFHDLATAIEDGAGFHARKAELPLPLAGELDGASPAPDPHAAAQALGELYQRRSMAGFLQEGLTRQRDGETTADLMEWILEKGAAVQEAIAATRPGGLVWGADLEHLVMGLAKKALASKESGRATLGTPTGLADLDRTLNGLNPGLYVLGGAPGVGKTSLALQWAMKAADEVPVVYVTYENSPLNLALKAMGRLANVPPSDVERGVADLEKLQEGGHHFRRLSRLAFVEGTASTTTASIQGLARQAMAHHRKTPHQPAPRCLVIVDYLQRMAHASGYGTLRENVSALTLGLRKLATQLDSPVLAISSLSRGVNNYAHPTLEALKESGDLEFTADVVLLLGARENPLGRGPRRMVDLEVAKNRFGEADRKVGLSFNPALGDFGEEART